MVYVVTLLLPITVFSQDDLLGELEQVSANQKQFSSAAFKGSRLVSGHTVETRGKGELEFIFQHRFGLIKGGAYELFGLDQASVRLGLDYGITNRLSISISRNSVDKTMDGYAKIKLLKQAKGPDASPVTLTAFGGVAYQFLKTDAQLIDPINRLAYVTQLLVARKFTPWLSLQLMPTLVHKNSVNQLVETNDIFALGVGGRLKVSRSIALTAEYFPRLNAPNNAALAEQGLAPKYDAFGLGIDIETGGHVFQLLLTTTNTLTERAFIAENTGLLPDGDLHFGFNVTRGFQVGKRK